MGVGMLRDGLERVNDGNKDNNGRSYIFFLHLFFTKSGKSKWSCIKHVKVKVDKEEKKGQMNSGFVLGRSEVEM